MRLLSNSRIIIICLYLCTWATYAQSLKLNLKEFDEHKLHFGIRVAYVHNFLTLSPSPLFVTQDSVNMIDQTAPGFSIGMLVSRNMSRYTALRASLLFNIHAKSILYQNVFDAEDFIERSREEFSIEMPVEFKFKSTRRENRRAYFSVGLNPSFRFASRSSRIADEDNIAFLPLNFEAFFSMGLNNFQEFINFSPEIRFAYGLMNVFDSSPDNIYTQYLRSAKTFKVSLFLNFER